MSEALERVIAEQQKWSNDTTWQRDRARRPPPAARYAVVLHPGTLWQQVDTYCSTLNNAISWQRDMFPHEDGTPTDVMRVLPDGSLTTEL